MAQFVEVLVIFPLDGTIFLRRDNGVHPLSFRLFENGVCVIAAISQQMFGVQSFNQAASLRAIRSATLRDKYSERHTMRIHGQMYLGIEPPFVRLMS